MNTRIFYTLPDGRVARTTPTPALVMEFLRYGKATGTLLWRGDPVTSSDDVMSLAEAINAAIAHVIQHDLLPGATNVVVGMVSDIPMSRFRAWHQVGTTLPTVDMPLARAQRMAEIRAERDKRLVASDSQFARAQDIGTPAEVAALKLYRQRLRDIPQTVNLDSLATPEELADFEPLWPVSP